MSGHETRSADAFVFAAPEPGGSDGIEDMIWIDLDPPLEAHDEAAFAAQVTEPLAGDADPLPVLMVIADQQDFYFQEY